MWGHDLGMTHFEDLTPYSYLGPGEEALNVGWLNSGHPFPVGQTDSAAVAKVLRMVRDEPVNRTRGWHRCDLCARPAEPARPERPGPVRMTLDRSPVYLGDCEIRVRSGTGLVYAAPSLLPHYIAAHGYQPPPEFMRALSQRTNRASP